MRYRYDTASSTRIITVELIVEKKDLAAPQQKFADNAEAPVRVVYGELELGKLARSAGGRWDADVKLWNIPDGKIKAPELEKHLILDSEMKQKSI